MLLEIAVRVVPLYPASFAIPDSVLGWRYRPEASGAWFSVGCPREFNSQVRLNRRGAHDIEHSTPDPGARNLLILGDSLVAALEVPVEDTFFRQLDPLLDASAPTEVYAAGHAGYSTAQNWLYFQRYGDSFADRPDAVLLVFTPHNDIMDNHPAFAAMSIDWVHPRPYFALDESGGLTPIAATAPPMPPLHRFMLEQSALYRLLSVRLRGLLPPVDLTQPEYVAARAEGWRVTYALLDALRDSVEASGARFGVVIDQSILAPDERRAVHAQLAAELETMGIAHLSLLDPFDSAADQVRYPCDSHWTPEGHRIAAAAIAPFAEGLLEG